MSVTLEQVQVRIDAIRAAMSNHDDERCHSAEDELHQDVLRAIANGAENPTRLAAEALKTVALQFSRWYA